MTKLEKKKNRKSKLAERGSNISVFTINMSRYNSSFYQIGLKYQIINFLNEKYFKMKQHQKFEK